MGRHTCHSIKGWGPGGSEEKGKICARQGTCAKNELNVEERGGEFYVCNTPGLGLAGLAERVRVIKAKDLQKDKQILFLGKEIKSHKEEITELKGNVTTLTLAGQDDEYASDS